MSIDSPVKRAIDEAYSAFKVSSTRAAEMYSENWYNPIRSSYSVAHLFVPMEWEIAETYAEQFKTLVQYYGDCVNMHMEATQEAPRPAVMGRPDARFVEHPPGSSHNEYHDRVSLSGREYYLSSGQAAVVRVLDEAYHQGKTVLSGREIRSRLRELAVAGEIKEVELHNVFRKWGPPHSPVQVIPGKRGFYRLSPVSTSSSHRDPCIHSYFVLVISPYDAQAAVHSLAKRFL